MRKHPSLLPSILESRPLDASSSNASNTTSLHDANINNKNWTKKKKMLKTMLRSVNGYHCGLGFLLCVIAVMSARHYKTLSYNNNNNNNNMGESRIASASSSSSSSSISHVKLHTTNKPPFLLQEKHNGSNEDDKDMFTSFTKGCYMVDNLNDEKGESFDEGSTSGDYYDDDDDVENDDENAASSSSSDSNDGDDDDEWFFTHYPDGSVGRNDPLHLGRCRHDYPVRTPPPAGYLNDFDHYFFRDSFQDRERCFLYCLTQLDRDEVTNDLLVDAVRMGLPRVTRQLLREFGHQLDVLAKPSRGENAYPRPGFNAVQEAIRGGYAQVLSLLTNNQHDMVIDDFGRTVLDYITMRGSAIRPHDAKRYLGVDTTESQRTVHQSLDHAVYRGWNATKSRPADDRCDLEVVNEMTREIFYKDYFMTGRPFVLRNAIPEKEMETFSKQRWSTTEFYNMDVKVRVGAQGKPSMTGQQYCRERLTIPQLEAGGYCPSTPGIPMFRSADIPDDDHYDEIFPLYDGDPFHPKGGWRTLLELFGQNYEASDPDFYLFFGGDESGASWHWHNAAFNVLYVGLKQWRVAPPLYRGITAIHSDRAQHMLDDDWTLRCTQGPGDFIHLPDFWGHLVVNSGFTVGTATLAVEPLDRMIPEDKNWMSTIMSKISFRKQRNHA